MFPGAIQLMRILYFAHSMDRLLVRFTIPARAAPVCAIPGIPRHIQVTMLIIFPIRFGIIHLLATACVMNRSTDFLAECIMTLAKGRDVVLDIKAIKIYQAM
jgi:hypothetical protein